MAEIRLPRYLLAKKCLKGGIRLFPLPKLVIERRRLVVNSSLSTLFGIIDGENKFDGSEYRFWMPLLNDGKIVDCECRACGAVIKTMVGRREHQDTIGCTKIL